MFELLLSEVQASRQILTLRFPTLAQDRGAWAAPRSRKLKSPSTWTQSHLPTVRREPQSAREQLPAEGSWPMSASQVRLKDRQPERAVSDLVWRCPQSKFASPHGTGDIARRQ